ncbi:MAG: oxidoreductase [Planctomycetia bacterium TMED53]|nr:MAG: oxidoreductase [Planctomycetia bacterium TMED53]
MKPAVGWIGTGVMGSSMAGHLVEAGFQVGVFTRSQGKAEALLSAGATWYDSPMSLAQHHDIVISIVGYPTDVEEIYLGELGLFSAVEDQRKCRIAIDMTTSQPALARALYEKGKDSGISFLDAPVSGGDVGAKNGTLSIMVGGDEDVFREVAPVFEVLGSQIQFQGSAGSGQHTKMVNQTIIASTMIGMCEGLVYARKAGLDPLTVLQSVSGGAAGSWSLSNLAPRVLKGDFDPGFFVEHFVKDMDIALDECEQMGIDLPGLTLARKLYEKVVSSGGEKLGTQALYSAVDELSHESVKRDNGDRG